MHDPESFQAFVVTFIAGVATFFFTIYVLIPALGG